MDSFPHLTVLDLRAILRRRIGGLGGARLKADLVALVSRDWAARQIQWMYYKWRNGVKQPTNTTCPFTMEPLPPASLCIMIDNFRLPVKGLWHWVETCMAQNRVPTNPLTNAKIPDAILVRCKRMFDLIYGTGVAVARLFLEHGGFCGRGNELDRGEPFYS